MFTLLTTLLLTISLQEILMMLLWIVAIGLICWLLWWLIGYVGLPEPFNKVARVIVAVLAVLFLINAILMLVGKPFIVW